MPRAGFFFNSKVLDEVETSTVTPGARELQAIGGGRYIPGRAGSATISIALTPIVRTAILTAQRHDHVVMEGTLRAPSSLSRCRLDRKQQRT